MNVMQNTSTPRAPSPSPQVIPNFMPQPSSSPRVPSPISKSLNLIVNIETFVNGHNT